MPRPGDTGDIGSDVPPGVDVLVVVDNSASMAEEQALLSGAMYELIHLLDRPVDGAMDDEPDFPAVNDIRVAVVTSDMGLQWGEGNVGGNTVDLQGCDDPGDDGEFQTRPPDVVSVMLDDGENTCHSDIAGRFGETSSESPNPDLALQAACLVIQGGEGCGIEQPMKAAQRGLQRYPEFLVPGHVLAILIVSDEEDCSIESNALFDTPEWLSGAQAVNHACFLPETNEQYLLDAPGYASAYAALKGGAKDDIVFAAIVGTPIAEECQGFGDAIPECLDHRDMYRGVQFCDPGPCIPPIEPACVRSVDGVEVTSALPGRRLVQLAREFQNNGYVYSICNDDWSPAVRDIAALISRKVARDGA